MATFKHCRLPDWNERLKELVRAKQYEPFVWGRHDCALWGGDVVEAMTGTDWSSLYRGTYTTPLGAAKRLRQIHNVTQPQQLADQLFGERVHVSHLVRGDLIASAPESELFGPVLGLCYGRQSLFAGVEAGQDRLVNLQTLSQIYGWKIWPKSSKVLSRQ